MAVVRWGGQAPLPFIDHPRCYVCWYLTLEDWKGRFAIPLDARTDEGICPNHRARLGEGACLFCGRRLAWLRMASRPELAICRGCFVQRKGEAVPGGANWRSAAGNPFTPLTASNTEPTGTSSESPWPQLATPASARVCSRVA